MSSNSSLQDEGKGEWIKGDNICNQTEGDFKIAFYFCYYIFLVTAFVITHGLKDIESITEKMNQTKNAKIVKIRQSIPKANFNTLD